MVADRGEGQSGRGDPLEADGRGRAGTPAELRQAAEDENLWTLQQDCELKAREGLISWDEFRRLASV